MFHFPSLFDSQARIPNRLAISLAVLGLATFFCGPTNAQDIRWKNHAGGEFSDAVNWDNGVPTSSNNAMFVIDAVYGVKLTSNATINSFQQTAGDVTLFGGNRLLANQESNFNSILTISDSGTEFRGLQNLLIGSGGAGSLGIVNVINDAEFNGANLFLGATADGKNDSGIGHLKIDSGAKVQIGNNTSGFNFSGGQLIVSDSAANGNLVVRNGSTVNGGQVAIVGLDSGSRGTTEVTGKDSLLSSQFLIVGYSGEGELAIDDSAVVSNSDGTVATNVGSVGSVIVNGANSAWYNSGQLIMGRSGDGTLLIQNGADVTSDDGFLGLLSGSNGTATISGAGSNWQTSNLFMGAIDAATDGGEGQLNIGPGAYLRIGNDASLRGSNTLVVSDSGANGNLIVRNRSKITNDGDGVLGLGSNMSGTSVIAGNGSLLTNTGDFVVGSSGNGRTSILEGGSVFNVNGVVAATGNSSGDVTVDGIRSTWNNSGDLVVGGAGNATMIVRNQGAVINQDGFVGAIAGGIGTATVKDAGSVWLNRNLFLGTRDGAANDGVGTVAVESGGIIQVGNDNAIPISLSQLVVSDTGTNGKLNVRNGSTVTNDGVSIFGLRTATRGDATINGAVSELNAGSDLIVGLTGKSDINVENGGKVSNGSAVLGANVGSRGIVNVVQSGSQWNTNSQLVIGSEGQGFMNVLGGGVANADFTIMGQQAGSESILNVFGAGSQFNSTSGLVVANQADATLSIQEGGEVTTGNAFVGRMSGSTGSVSMSNADSKLFSSNLFVGAADEATDGGVGSLTLGGATVRVGNDFNSSISGGMVVSDTGANGKLVVRNGSTITQSSGAVIGNRAGSNGAVTFNNSTWDLPILGGGASIRIGNFGNGSLRLENGSVATSADVTLGLHIDGTGTLEIDGAGSRLTSDFLIVGSSGQGTVNVTGGGRMEASSVIIANHSSSSGVVSVSGTDSQLTSIGVTRIGDGGSGLLEVRSGGAVDSTSFLVVGDRSGSQGTVVVDGIGSVLAFDEGINVGWDGDGTLSVTNGGKVSSTDNTFFGRRAGAVGNGLISGNGSELKALYLYLGTTSATASGGKGFLQIKDGGQVRVGDDLAGFGGTGLVVSSFGASEGLIVANGSQLSNDGSSILGYASGTTGNALIKDSDSQLINNQNLFVGYNGTGSLDITNGALASNDSGVIGNADSSSGTVTVTGAGSQWNNSSDLLVGRFGSGNLVLSQGGVVSSANGYLGNFSTGSGNVSLTGTGSSWNLSDNLTIGNFGVGDLEIDDAASVSAGGIASINTSLSRLLIGQGQFSSVGGLTNQGLITSVAGIADIHGDVNHLGGGRIVTTDSAVLNFHDGVLHNGAEVQTLDGGSTIFLGEYSGAGSFTGTGDVFFESDFRPGNSPDVIDFAGDVFFGQESGLFFELAGTDLGEFDMLNIAGDLALDGTLNVQLIDGFTLGLNQEFLIADVFGSSSGQFIGLSEGDLVGTYGGRDLFISYTGGNGDGVSLFTAVPEPGSIAWLGLIGLGAMLRRRRIA